MCIRTSGLIKFNCSVSICLGLIKIQPCFWASRSGLADLHRAILQQTIKVIKAYNNSQYNVNTPLTYKSSRKWFLEAFSSASGDKNFWNTLFLSLRTLSLSMGCLLFSNEAKENDSKINEHNTNPFEFLEFLCYLLHTWMKNCMKDFHVMWEREPWIHLPFICGGWGGYILGDHPFLFSPLFLADCPSPRFSHKQPSGILSVPHIYLLQDLLQEGWRISQLGGMGVYMKLQPLQGRFLTYNLCICRC